VNRGLASALVLPPEVRSRDGKSLLGQYVVYVDVDET
jgi:hypothetical protein